MRIWDSTAEWPAPKRTWLVRDFYDLHIGLVGKFQAPGFSLAKLQESDRVAARAFLAQVGTIVVPGTCRIGA